MVRVGQRTVGSTAKVDCKQTHRESVYEAQVSVLSERMPPRKKVVAKQPSSGLLTPSAIHAAEDVPSRRGELLGATASGGPTPGVSSDSQGPEMGNPGPRGCPIKENLTSQVAPTGVTTDEPTDLVSVPKECWCEECKKAYKSKGGLALHRRSKHAEAYHEEVAKEVNEGTKKRWDREESVVMARQELKLLGTGKKVFINQELVKCMPGRTLEAIKGQRKSAEYRALLVELGKQPQVTVATDIPPPAASVPSMPSLVQIATPGASSDRGAQSPIHGETEPMEGLRRFCENNTEWFKLSEAETAEILHPLTQKGRVQELVDKEWCAWVPSGARPCPAQSQASSAPTRQRWSAASRNQRRNAGPKLSPSRRKRRTQYAEVQRLYSKNRSKCAGNVLSGDWEKVPNRVSIEAHEKFWGPLMEEPSEPDSRCPNPLVDPLVVLLEPLSKVELDNALKSMADGAPGPDGIERAELRRMNREDLLTHLNLWLWCGIPPSEFRVGYTTLIPKTADASQPEQHRPITVATIFARLFHRILAGRIEKEIPLSPRQKAFRKGDGLADNVWILRSLIREHTSRTKPLCMAFVDVAKAFDSVSHESLWLAAGRMGLPRHLIGYLRNLYSGVTTQLKVNGTKGRIIRCRRGVRQGDPLSPLLFNMVLDWVLGELDSELGIKLGASTRVNHLAFADDTAILTTTPQGLVKLLGEMEVALSKVGLRPNAKKSATLRIVVHGKSQRWAVDAKAFASLAGSVVPAMSITDVYRYLGVQMGAVSKKARAGDKLLDGLRQLRRAPLKPQQRMYLLRVHLIPSLYHQLVLDEAKPSLMRYLDRVVRAAVRQWLRLPHDCPRALFHADASAGGLGLPEFGVCVPIFRKDRIDGVLNRAFIGDDPVLRHLAEESSEIRKERNRWRQVNCYGALVANKPAMKIATARALHTSVDGSGLVYHGDVPQVHNWVTGGTKLQTGAAYIHAIQVRSACLHTSGRAARGRAEANTSCECCGRYESLAHIVQVCPSSWAPRNSRHDTAVKYLADRFTRMGYQTVVEPKIPTRAGVRCPDLVVYKPGVTLVLDASIVSDQADLNHDHALKVAYYDVPEIRQYVAALTNSQPHAVLFSAMIANWRGAISRHSSNDLCTYGVTLRQQEVLMVRILQAGFNIYVGFKKGTTRNWNADYGQRLRYRPRPYGAKQRAE